MIGPLSLVEKTDIVSGSYSKLQNFKITLIIRIDLHFASKILLF